jgi:hypothetical protein
LWQFHYLVIRLEDIATRIRDTQTSRDILLQDLRDGWFSCSLWTADGIRVTSINYLAITGSTRLPVIARFVRQNLGNESGDAVSRYRETWNNLFEKAAAFSKIQFMKAGSWFVTNRFFTVPQQDRNKIELFLAPGVGYGPTQTKDLLEHLRDQFFFDMAETTMPCKVYSLGKPVSADDVIVSIENVKYIKLSVHPLGFYSTWVKEKTLELLIDLQIAEPNGSWVRTMPNAAAVIALNELIQIERQNKKRIPYADALTPQTKSSMIRTGDDVIKKEMCVSPGAIMGASANKVCGTCAPRKLHNLMIFPFKWSRGELILNEVGLKPEDAALLQQGLHWGTSRRVDAEVCNSHAGLHANDLTMPHLL